MTTIMYVDRPSAGARELRRALGIRKLRRNLVRTKFRWRTTDTVINWGVAGGLPIPGWQAPRWINHPDCVEVAVNKLMYYDHASEEGVPVPKWTASQAEAINWLENRDCKKVVVRRVLRGSGGVGIEVITSPDAVPHAPLYTQYVPKRHEYRAHVVGGTVIDVQRKMKRHDFEGTTNYSVRNLDNGWVYGREGVHLTRAGSDVAVRAVQAAGLEFGAVDLGWTAAQDAWTVYEVNTAPGLEGTTIQRYAEAFRRFLG